MVVNDGVPPAVFKTLQLRYPLIFSKRRAFFRIALFDGRNGRRRTSSCTRSNVYWSITPSNAPAFLIHSTFATDLLQLRIRVDVRFQTLTPAYIGFFKMLYTAPCNHFLPK